jgi:uncharacterized protein (TIGR03083 family)
MTADKVIAALHAGHDQLAPIVRSLTPEQLTGTSAAAEWSVAQVLSHLGSGAEIGLAGLEAAVAGQPIGGLPANQEVWTRWNAMSGQQQADGYLASNEKLLARYDSLDEQQRQDLRIDMGFLPAPVDVATAGRFRLQEFALHSWDVRVAGDPAAVVHPAAVELLLDHVGVLLGWIAKPAALGGRSVATLVTLTDPDRRLGLQLGEPSSLGEAPAQPDAELHAPAEAWLRLLTGRLSPAHTPASVSVTGAVDLATLRQVFQGY